MGQSQTGTTSAAPRDVTKKTIAVFANLLSYSNCVHVVVKIQKWFSLLVRSLLTGRLLIRDYKRFLEQALINSNPRSNR